MRGWGGDATASLSSLALMAAADGEIGGRARYWDWDSFYRHGMGRGVSWEARLLHLGGNVAWGRLERGDGEVAARQAALASAGCRGAFPAGLGRVEARGEEQGGPRGGKTRGAGA